MNDILNFDQAVAFESRRQGVHGLVCGHIHHAEIREIHGVLYRNDGDSVASCTSLVERHDGAMELLRWSDAQSSLTSLATEAAIRAA